MSSESRELAAEQHKQSSAPHATMLSIRDAARRRFGGMSDEEFDAMWSEQGKAFEESVRALGITGFDRRLTAGELDQLHWVVQEQYRDWLVKNEGSLPALIKQNANSIPLGIEKVPAPAIGKPRDFLAALAPGEAGYVPDCMSISGVRNAAYALRIRITTKFQAGKWLVYRLPTI